MNLNQEESIDYTKNNHNTSDLKSIDDQTFINSQTSAISKENIPVFKKILILDDGEDESNKEFNYAISLSNYSGAELIILRILENVENIEDISIEASSSNTGNSKDPKDMKRKIEGEIIDRIEQKIKKFKDAGCENEISYKFRTGGNAVDEIVNEVKEGNYDIILLKSGNIDSWMKSLFSDTRKILGNVTIPVLIVQ